jgi:ribosomal protein L35AE/L33A
MGPGLETAVSGCDYATGKGDLTLAVRRTTSEAAGRLRQMVQMVCQGKEAVPGVGEVACWYSPQHGELQALQGTVFLTVELHGGRGAAEALREVARKALARAPR